MIQTLLPRGKKSVQWAAEQLVARGYTVSHSKVRRYSNLLLGQIVRVGEPHHRERRYTELDIDRLETIFLLKGLGMTDKEVLVWVKVPEADELEGKIRKVKQFIARAGQLVESLRQRQGLHERTPSTDGHA